MPKKILLADDSVTIQKVIAITLASEDYVLTVVGDGDAAVAKARELKPDLVIADVAMPGKNGYEVCNQVKKEPETRGTPVLLLAGTFEPLNKAEAARVGADDSIVKPFESQELIDKIARLVQAKRPAVAAAVASPVPVHSVPEPPHKAAEPPRQAAAPRKIEIAREFGHLSVEEEITPPEVSKPELDVSEELWEPGDFIGFPEAPEVKGGEPESKGGQESEAVDRPVVSAATPAPPLPKPEELAAAVAEFTDLEFPEDEFSEAKTPAAQEAVEPAEASGEVEPFDLSAFEVEPPKAEPPRVEAAQTPRPAEEKPLKLEAPKERVQAIEIPAAEDVVEDESPAAREEVRERPKESRPPTRPEPERSAPPLRVVSSQPPPSEPIRVAELVEREKVAAIQPPQAPAAVRAPEPVAPTVITAPTPQPAAPAAAASAPQVPALSEEQVAEIVRKTAKEIIERIAWDIVPELAEEFIKTEMKRVRDAIADKFKSGGG